MNLVKSEREEILRACATLFVPGQVVELRALDATTPDWRKPHTVSGYFDDWTKLAAAATALTAKGTYITLNPVNPALLARSSNRVRAVGGSEATTNDADIISRRWLPIDCDPVRPSGISASDEEHAAALDRVEQVRTYLGGLGWPEPVVADSGNGAHLLYRIDLPANDAGLIAGVLTALACHFDDDLVKVYRKVANPARIWKL